MEQEKVTEPETEPHFWGGELSPRIPKKPATEDRGQGGRREVGR